MVRGRRRRAGHRRLPRCLDQPRWRAVPRLRGAPAATTPTSATRSCRSWTLATGRLPGAAHRGVAGKSSGGYGAMVTPMLRPDLFGGLVTHACDARSSSATPRLPRRGAGTARGYDGSYEASGRTSARARAVEARPTARCSTCGAWPPATPPIRTAPCACRSTPLPAASLPETWERWLAWIRFAWRRSTPTRFAACGRSGSTRVGRTTSISTSAPPPSAASSSARHRRRPAALRAVRRDACRHRLALPRGNRLAGGVALQLTGR